MTNLGILIVSTPEYWRLIDVTRSNKEKCAARWSLGLSIIQISAVVPHRIAEIMRHLANYDWLWYQGADTVVTNMEIDPRVHCRDGYDLVIGEDVNGINDDSIFLRNCSPTMEMLSVVATNCGGKFQDEQRALAYLLGDSQDWRVLSISPKIPGLRPLIVDQREFNSYPDYDYYGKSNYHGRWQPGDLLAHFPGMDLDRRIIRCAEILTHVTEASSLHLLGVSPKE